MELRGENPVVCRPYPYHPWNEKLEQRSIGEGSRVSSSGNTGRLRRRKRYRRCQAPGLSAMNVMPIVRVSKWCKGILTFVQGRLWIFLALCPCFVQCAPRMSFPQNTTPNKGIIHRAKARRPAQRTEEGSL
uniref:Uncharacterized protein n=1 Tax=Opuntia streptacantha TaxID=393608 RepID=A0A7C9EZE6_OPUST